MDNWGNWWFWSLRTLSEHQDDGPYAYAKFPAFQKYDHDKSCPVSNSGLPTGIYLINVFCVRACRGL